MTDNYDAFESLKKSNYFVGDIAIKGVENVADKHGKQFQLDVLGAIIHICYEIENDTADSIHDHQRDITVSNITNFGYNTVIVAFTILSEYTGNVTTFSIAFKRGNSVDEIISYDNPNDSRQYFGIDIDENNSIYNADLTPVFEFIDESLA